MSGLLLVNPRSGNGSPSAEELVEAARGLGVRVHVLRPGEDLAELAREADADMLGIAGGDGSLAAVAAVAIDRDLPFVCVPFGTRNHFAGDVGLDGDPLAALRAFAGGEERRIDVGRVGDRLFLNNLSLGLYARLVHRRERRRRRREVFARLKALAVTIRDRRLRERFLVDGQSVSASVLLVANNEYRLDALSLGARDRLDEGVLVLYAARGLRRLRWAERRATELEIETRKGTACVAIDGEPAILESPLRLTVEPQALRLRVPAS